MSLYCPNIPRETDADVAMSVIKPCIDMATQGRVCYSYKFKGVFDRTADGDTIQLSIKERSKGPSTISVALNRDSLYHILPEYIFHPIDWYYGTKGDPKEFKNRFDLRVEQEKNAITYFKIFDQEYQVLRVKLQMWLNDHVFKGNQFLSDFITNGLAFNRNNIFIMAVYPCLAWLRNHRGNRDMMETALHYAFLGNASVDYIWRAERMPLKENIHSTADRTIDDLFCGTTFATGAYTWYVRYQTTIGTEARLVELQREIKEFEEFFSLWFLSVEDKLHIDFGDFQESPVLTTPKSPTGIFLNYSTQLI